MSGAARSVAAVLAAAAVAGTAMTGCGTVSGVAVPAAMTPGKSTPDGRDWPERPREVPLDDLDPCALVARAEWPEFGIVKPGKLSTREVFRSPHCLYSTDMGIFSVATVVTEGIESWTGGERRGTVVAVAGVLGFPSATVLSEGDKYRCDVAVDVADGQYLLATAIPSTTRSDLADRCDYARQLAESAMSTVTTTG